MTEFDFMRHCRHGAITVQTRTNHAIVKMSDDTLTLSAEDCLSIGQMFIDRAFRMRTNLETD